MEKYRKFADPGTGVNPFLPVHLATPGLETRIVRISRSLILSILAIARIPLLMVWVILLGVSDLLFMVPIISYLFITPIIRPVVCWIGLVLLGLVVNPSMRLEDFRRLRVKRPVHESYVSGHLTFSPYYGFIDILVHATVTKPSAFALKSRSDSWTLYRSVLLAISACRFGATSLNSTAVPKLPKHSLVFLHSVPSNGLGLLKLDPAPLPQLAKDKPFQVTKINYYSGSFAPHHLVGSFMSHVVSLLLKNGLTTASVVSLPEPITETNNVAVMLSRLSEPAPETQVTEESYHEFVDYWNKTQDISYVRT